MQTLNARLDALLEAYLAGWGPIRWREELAQASPEQDSVLATALFASSVIETDTMLVQMKLRLANIDRRKALRDFNTVWQAEESEHGRALRHIALLLARDGAHVPPRRTKSLKLALTFPGLIASRLTLSLVEAAYLVTGTAAEYVAITTYREFARLVRDEQTAYVLRLIAAQEGRHLHFYRNAAEACLDTGRNRQSVAKLLKHFWRPPGTESLGQASWVAAFKPLYKNEEYREKISGLDHLISNVLRTDITIMRDFMQRNGL